MQEHRLPHAPEAAALARDLAVRASDGLVSPDRMDDFVLMVSEAVTNAFRHASTGANGNIGLRLERRDGVLRGVVIDGGTGFAPYEVSRDGDGHFGLRIIDALSDRWGVTVDGTTHVWFEVDVAGASARNGLTAV
jgi:anti-sigma regulatory factor (Ser/Thr protein kinase)